MSERFQQSETFVKLPVKCIASGFYQESTTESVARTGLDGVEREDFFCVDTYRYNFSVGNDRSIELSGEERLRRSEKTCEASAVEGMSPAAARLKVGDRADGHRH